MTTVLQKKQTIIAIPFAGGNRYSFSKITKEITKDYNWITLELPGRGSRFGEPLLDNIQDMVIDLYQKIKPHIAQGDYMLYGHSMGTLLGYELIKKIIENNLKQPICIFFTGKAAPEHCHYPIKKSKLPPDLFWEAVRKIGGLPKDIMAHNELLALYYPILKADFKAIEAYEYIKVTIPFQIPIVILMGEEEIDSKMNSIANVKDWSKETSSFCNIELIKGDHFFILKESKKVADLVMKSYKSCQV